MSEDRDQVVDRPDSSAEQDEYPGPRRASTGEQVNPDPGNPPPRPGGAGARRGEPAAASDRTRSEAAAAEAARGEGIPTSRPDDEGTA